MKCLLAAIVCGVVLTGCAQKAKEVATTPEEVSEKVQDKKSWEYEQAVTQAIDSLPELQLPFQFTFSHSAGVDILATESVLYDVLAGEATQPMIKRVLRRVQSYNASVIHIFWIGKQYPQLEFWRSYVTTVDDRAEVYKSTELDANLYTFERCEPKIIEHDRLSYSNK